jgi:2-polyprenyl-3-methyl-5-hydroxy-6-metoxy-1,4-benzoquinol methylase
MHVMGYSGTAMPVTNCALCKSSDLALILDLGFHPLADTFLKKEWLLEEESRYPLQVLLCRSCGHAMNSYRVPPAKRYQEREYSYDSSNSKVSITHFGDMAKEISAAVGVGADDLVVDVGGNVGTLLSAFHEQTGAKVLNVEPSANIAALAVKNGVETINDFFNAQVAAEIKKRGGAKVITGTNVFNHIDELDEFMNNIVGALTPDGAFMFEAPYLLQLVEKLAFDTIYLEHVSYFAFKALVPYFKKFGLTITEIVENEYMGGSVRVTARLGNVTETPLVASCIQKEEAAKLYDTATYEAMTKKMQEFKFSLLRQLIDAKLAGGKAIGIGAATKGNTLLNYCGIDASMLDFVTDASPLKVGKYTPGSHILIQPDEAITSEITHALILPWNIAEFLKGKLAPKYPSLSFIIPHV